MRASVPGEASPLAWEVRLSSIHRFKGLESPVVVLAEIDGRVPEAVDSCLPT